MGKKRPVNLDLTTIDFPMTAIASILHRISGVIIFLALPVILCLFERSLKSAEHFALVQHWLQQPVGKAMQMGLLLAVIYHTLAGLRHLIMDFGIGESFCAAKASAGILFILTILTTIVVGATLW